MKIHALLIGLLTLGVTNAARANDTKDIDIQAITAGINAVMNIATATPEEEAAMALIDWKVGDTQDYKVTLSMGLEGTMHKEAFKEEGNGVWIRQEMKLPIMNDTSELLMDRNSGKILKYVHNGKEENIPDGKIDVIATKNDVVEVPAGKFKVLHVTAKSKDVKQIDIWANMREISLDGTAKVVLDQGQIQITMELASFKKQ
jgi:hypothetical protein